MKHSYERHAKAGISEKRPEIERFENQFKDYEITISALEFSSICPKTKLPDTGAITIRYKPRKLCLELKSLKMYLLSYRNSGIFCENSVNCILRDIVRACAPEWAVVTGEFAVRGGLKSVIEARYKK